MKTYWETKKQCAFEEIESDQVPEVLFLNPPSYPFSSELKSTHGPPQAKFPKLCVTITDSDEVRVIQTSCRSSPLFAELTHSSTEEFGLTEAEHNKMISTLGRPNSVTERIATGPAEYTLSEDLISPTKTTLRSVMLLASIQLTSLKLVQGLNC